jgi:limonene-1,2-epoxide hydrolase
MSSEEAEAAQAIVTTFIAAIERGDVDGAIACMTEDCEYDNVPMAKAIGHEQIRTTLSMFISPDAKTQFEIIRQAATGNVVMNERIDRLTVFGKQVELPVAGVFEVRDGKIALWRDYFDLQQFTNQTS